MVYKLVYLLICWAPLAEPGQFPSLRGQEASRRLGRVLEISFPLTILSHWLVVRVISGLLYVTSFHPERHAWSHSTIRLVPAFSSEINKRLVLVVNHKSTKNSKHWTDVQYLRGRAAEFPCKQSDSTTTDYKSRVCFKELIMAMKYSLTWWVFFFQWLHIVNSWEKQPRWINMHSQNSQLKP